MVGLMGGARGGWAPAWRGVKLGGLALPSLKRRALESRVSLRGMVLVLVGLGGLAGCVHPWERGALTHRSMDSQSFCEQLRADFSNHVYDIREAASGGLGRPGGGCGCN